MPVGTGQTVSLYAVIYEVRSGTCDINIEHNGAAIATGLAVSATPATTAVFSASVGNNDTFQVVITSVSSADGLSCSFYFELS